MTHERKIVDWDVNVQTNKQVAQFIEYYTELVGDYV